ncbi:hypothetical protein Plhal304r1_c009g0036371 [Plasmopara halstedii]
MERGFSKCCVLMKGGKVGNILLAHFMSMRISFCVRWFETTKSSRHQYSFNVDKGGSTALLLLFIKTKTEVPK